MRNALSSIEIDGQQVELLPTRTVMGIFSVFGIFGAPKTCDATTWGPSSTPDTGDKTPDTGDKTPHTGDKAPHTGDKAGESSSYVKGGPGKSIDGFGPGGGHGVGGDGGHGEQRVITTPGVVSHNTQDVSGGDGIGGSVRVGS